MVCVHVLTLPQSSSAVHVLVIVYSVSQIPEAIVTSENSTSGMLQLSVAVANA